MVKCLTKFSGSDGLIHQCDLAVGHGKGMRKHWCEVHWIGETGYVDVLDSKADKGVDD